MSGDIIKYIKNRRQEQKEAEQQPDKSSTTPRSPQSTFTKWSTANAVNIKNGNDYNKSRVDNENNHNQNKGVTLQIW